MAGFIIATIYFSAGYFIYKVPCVSTLHNAANLLFWWYIAWAIIMTFIMFIPYVSLVPLARHLINRYNRYSSTEIPVPPFSLTFVVKSVTIYACQIGGAYMLKIASNAGIDVWRAAAGIVLVAAGIVLSLKTIRFRFTAKAEF